MPAIQIPQQIVSQNSEEKFQHDRISVKNEERRKYITYRRLPGCDRRSKYLYHSHQNHQKCAADQTAVFHADVKGNEKQQIEQHFTVDGPADIKRNKQQTFDKIGKIVSGLLEHGRKQQQRQIGSQCHQVVKRKNPDQAFAEEIFGTFFRGKHDHESADTKKDVHTESSEVQKTDMLKYHKKSSQTA